MASSEPHDVNVPTEPVVSHISVPETQLRMKPTESPADDSDKLIPDGIQTAPIAEQTVSASTSRNSTSDSNPDESSTPLSEPELLMAALVLADSMESERRSSVALGKMREQHITFVDEIPDDTLAQPSSLPNRYPVCVEEIIAKPASYYKDPGSSKRDYVAPTRPLRSPRASVTHITYQVDTAEKHGVRIRKRRRTTTSPDKHVSKALNNLGDLFSRQSRGPRPRPPLSPRSVSPEHQTPGSWDLRGCKAYLSVFHFELENGFGRYSRSGLFFYGIDRRCGIRGARRLLAVLKDILSSVQILKERLDIAGSPLFDKIEQADMRTKSLLNNLEDIRDALLANESDAEDSRGRYKNETRALLGPQLERSASKSIEIACHFIDIVKEAKRQCPPPK